MARLAVIGHVEWVEFLAVDKLPGEGQITPGRSIRSNAGGGAVVAATVLANIGAKVDFYGAFGDDDQGIAAQHQLESRGITVHAARRGAPTRQVITFIDAAGERSIVTVGERLAPAGSDPFDWEELEFMDGAYFTAGDLMALKMARGARVLTATPRIAEQLPDIDDVELDALIYSANDDAERAWAVQLSGRADLLVVTDGAKGGRWSGMSKGRWRAVRPPGKVIDSYGAGDSFAAGFTFGLATSGQAEVGARIGAAAGAQALTHAGGP